MSRFNCEDCVLNKTDACRFGQYKSGDYSDHCPDLLVEQDHAYEKGREDVLREHREQCEGKCSACDIGGGFIDSMGKEVILPYPYAYKTDCNGDRYIKAEEVLDLILSARADAIDTIVHLVCKYYTEQERAGCCTETTCMIKQRIADFGEQIKETT